MSGKALTDGQYRELLATVFEGVPNREDLDPEMVRIHLSHKGFSHEAVVLLLGMTPWEAKERLRPKCRSSVNESPEDLLTIVEHQKLTLEKLQYPKRDYPGGTQYYKSLNQMLLGWWNEDYAAIGLHRVIVVDRDVQFGFLSQGINLYCQVEPSLYHPLKGVSTAYYLIQA